MSIPQHDYTVILDTAKYLVRVSPSTGYGWFEHKELGDERGGGLWFEDKELTDYDGVYELPAEVMVALRGAGYILDEAVS